MRLKQKLQQYLTGVSGTFGIAVKNLETGETAYINENVKFQSASSCKVAILAALLKEAHLGKVSLAEKIKITKNDFVPGSGIIQTFDTDVELTIKDLATMMIIVSDNLATDVILELIGKDKVNDLMHELGMKNSTVVHSIWELLWLYAGAKPQEKNADNYADLVKRLRETSDFQESTVFNTNNDNNWHTAYDMNVLLEQLAKKRAISEQCSEVALNIMRSQQFTTRVPYLLPDGLAVACKSGSLNGVVNDAGIVYRPNDKAWFVISVFSRNTTKVEGEQAIANLAKISYEHFMSSGI